MPAEIEKGSPRTASAKTPPTAAKGTFRRETGRYNPRESQMSILKVSEGTASEEDELDFELDYLSRLTTAQRFDMMFQRSRQIAEELLRRGHRRPAEVAKRS